MNSHKYDESFLELDSLLTDPENRKRQYQSCYSLNYAEINKMCKGNYTTSIVLSRIVYWWRPHSDGRSKFGAKLPGGKFALAKSASEMAIETGISKASAKRAFKNLEILGLITIPAVKRFSGHPTRHIVLNEPLFVKLFLKYYIEIQIELADHRKSLCRRDDIEKIECYKNRIQQLKGGNFDPRTDFPSFILTSPLKDANVIPIMARTRRFLDGNVGGRLPTTDTKKSNITIGGEEIGEKRKMSQTVETLFRTFIN